MLRPCFRGADPGLASLSEIGSCMGWKTVDERDRASALA